MRKTKEFQIQCGEHAGIIKAPTIGAAWRKLTKGKTGGFALLARWTFAGKPWFYQTPKSLDRAR
jgi:hypothetical protein